MQFESRHLAVCVDNAEVSLCVQALIKTDSFADVAPSRGTMQLVIVVEIDVMRIGDTGRMFRKMHCVSVCLWR